MKIITYDQVKDKYDLSSMKKVYRVCFKYKNRLPIFGIGFNKKISICSEIECKSSSYEDDDLIINWYSIEDSYERFKNIINDNREDFYKLKTGARKWLIYDISNNDFKSFTRKFNYSYQLGTRILHYEECDVDNSFKEIQKHLNIL